MRMGVVVIGRNEGQRLEHCLRSVAGRGFAMIYVDSGSCDGSPPQRVTTAWNETRRW